MGGVHRFAVLAAVAVVFTGAARYAGEFDWDHGRERAALVLAGLLAVPFLVHLGRRRSSPPVARSATWLLVCCCALLLARDAAVFLLTPDGPEPVDIAETTLAAARAMAEGHNPYLAAIDPHPDLLPERWREFAGFKYLPLMPVVYMPLGLPFGIRGLYATNLLLHACAAFLVFALGARLGSRETGWFAAILVLLVPFATFELLRQGATDLAALVPLLLALLLGERRPLAAGLLVGLSISTKLLPGALFFAVCLPVRNDQRLVYALGAALGLLPALAFLAAAPEPFVSNIVLFNALRPVDSTSWLYWAPSAARPLAMGALAIGLLGAAGWAWSRRRDLLGRVALAASCIAATLLLAPVCHRNYLLWWMPFMALLSACAANGSHRRSHHGAHERTRLLHPGRRTRFAA